MRAAVLFIAMMLLLSGCESSAEREERKLDMMKRAGATNADLCKQAKKITEEYLDAGDQGKYELADVTTGAYCVAAELDYISK